MDKKIGKSVIVLSNKINRNVENAAKIQSLKSINGTALWVISYLAENGNKDVYQRDIEKNFSIRRATVSKLINTMEANGLVKRESVVCDARLKKLVLTPLALEIHKTICNVFENYENKMTEGISNEELRVFFSVIEKISGNLDNK